jgi:hypothetical protein
MMISHMNPPILIKYVGAALWSRPSNSCIAGSAAVPAANKFINPVQQQKGPWLLAICDLAKYGQRDAGAPGAFERK